MKLRAEFQLYSLKRIHKEKQCQNVARTDLAQHRVQEPALANGTFGFH
jgi:hypothetical protein